MRMTRPLALLVSVAVVLGGCRREMVANPHLLQIEGAAAFDGTPEAFRTPEMPVFFVTDREIRRERPKGPEYGYERSKGIDYGVAVVGVSPAPTWEGLVEATTSPRFRSGLGLETLSVERQGEIAPIAPRLRVVDGRLQIGEDARSAVREEAMALNRGLDPWLDAGATDALVFVHGFNNTFDDAVFRTAELWHATGRTMVPIAYTWPAGAGLSLIGYSRDRESSEFTILHLKLLLYALAMNDRIERVHIVAHSRGTDVASSVIRELHLEQGRARELPPVHEAYKIHTLVLAAPDLDREVFNQRFVTENALMAPKRFIMYFSRRDSAIGIASWLFGSDRRLGRLRFSDFDEFESDRLNQVDALEVIDCDVREGGSDHSYAFENPAVLSDLILILRDDAYADDPERPLAQPFPGVWQITDDYLEPE